MEGNYCDDNPSLPLLNEDSLIQILLWLPVISLLRFKSVCKSWRAIIENTFFINTHNNTTTTTTTTTNKVVVGYSYVFHRGVIFTVSGDEFEVFDDLGISGPPGPELEFSEDDMYKYISMAGCCNGIICLHDNDISKSYIYSTISLWNPAIKQYRFLPIPFALEEKRNHEEEEEGYVDYYVDLGVDAKKKFIEHFVGFGFDVKTKDYKVLLITYDVYVEKIYLSARGVQVYSLSTDSWRCIDASDAQPNLILQREDLEQGHYLNGTYLFIAGYLYEGDEFQEEATNSSSSRQECFRNVIMSFDFTEEIFRTIQLPFDLITTEEETRNYAYVILFGDKIAVTNACHDWFYSPSATFDIWVLNESWSKFYTFVSNVLPKFITDNGEFILLGARDKVPKLKLLNVVTQEIKDLQCNYSEGLTAATRVSTPRVGVYKPSLIPIAGNGETDSCLQV